MIFTQDEHICHSHLHIQEPPAALWYSNVSFVSFVDKTEDFTITGQPASPAHHSRGRKGWRGMARSGPVRGTGPLSDTVVIFRFLTNRTHLSGPSCPTFPKRVMRFSRVLPPLVCLLSSWGPRSNVYVYLLGRLGGSWRFRAWELGGSEVPWFFVATCPRALALSRRPPTLFPRPPFPSISLPHISPLPPSPTVFLCAVRQSPSRILDEQPFAT